jgi:hypothetical protein
MCDTARPTSSDGSTNAGIEVTVAERNGARTRIVLDALVAGAVRGDLA